MRLDAREELLGARNGGHLHSAFPCAKKFSRKFEAFWRANRVEGCILNGDDPEAPDAADATEPESDDEECAGVVYPRRAQWYATWPASGSQVQEAE